jgi:RimJ/RimL family protein N-acetyltransferase
MSPRLALIPHVPDELLALLEGEAAYQTRSGRRLAAGVRDLFLAGSPEFFERLRKASAPDPWRFGFAVVHSAEQEVIGMCGFVGPPDDLGVVEMAYGIAPGYEGQGYATEAAGALVQFARESGAVRMVCAHTLAEINASTRILEKCGFRKTGEVIDPENNRVWRWEKLLY